MENFSDQTIFVKGPSSIKYLTKNTPIIINKLHIKTQSTTDQNN